jgi:hypothetical protein
MSSPACTLSEPWPLPRLHFQKNFSKRIFFGNVPIEDACLLVSLGKQYKTFQMIVMRSPQSVATTVSKRREHTRSLGWSETHMWELQISYFEVLCSRWCSMVCLESTRGREKFGFIVWHVTWCFKLLQHKTLCNTSCNTQIFCFLPNMNLCVLRGSQKNSHYFSTQH